MLIMDDMDDKERAKKRKEYLDKKRKQAEKRREQRKQIEEELKNDPFEPDGIWKKE